MLSNYKTHATWACRKQVLRNCCQTPQAKVPNLPRVSAASYEHCRDQSKVTLSAGSHMPYRVVATTAEALQLGVVCGLSPSRAHSTK